MSSKIGRNDPCPCGSGKKYKRCCLPREEMERIDAARQPHLWEGDEEFGGDDLDDDEESRDEMEEIPPFDMRTVTGISFQRGFVKTLDAIVTGEGLRATEWMAPSIPPELLDVLSLEALDELEGAWGDAAAADPIQIDLIELQTDDDAIDIEVLNRAAWLLSGDDEAKRLHRACEALEAFADRGTDTPAGIPADALLRRVAEPPPAFTLDEALKSHRNQRGHCELCGVEVTKSGAHRHVQKCAPDHDGQTGPLQELLHLRVTASGAPGYWLDVEVRADATLDALDRFLRGIWVECCGHLSEFVIDDVEYVSERCDPGFGGSFGRRVQRSMHTPLGRALSVERFTYDYDFGSTTRLQFDVRGARRGRIGRHRVRLLARNMPLVWPCAYCGEPAVSVCANCFSGDPLNPFFCRSHQKYHLCGDEALLPVVNSPRMGVCGYGAVT